MTFKQTILVYGKALSKYSFLKPKRAMTLGLGRQFLASCFFFQMMILGRHRLSYGALAFESQPQLISSYQRSTKCMKTPNNIKIVIVPISINRGDLGHLVRTDFPPPPSNVFVFSSTLTSFDSTVITLFMSRVQKFEKLIFCRKKS